MTADFDALWAPGYGAYAPNAVQRLVRGGASAMPDNWIGRQTAFTLRRLALAGLDHPLDVEVFGMRARLYPFGNVSSNRLLFTPQYFDPEERAAFAAKARATEGAFVFLDIGANIGGWSLFMAGVLGKRGRVLAFEPQPGIREQLEYNASLNPNAGIKIFPVALSDADGVVEFAISATNKGESSLRPKHEGGARIQVPARRLLGVLKQEGIAQIHGLKIDVEGAEDLVLSPFLKDAPDSLLPEMVAMERTQARWAGDLIGQMQARGYQIARTCRRNLVLVRL